MRQQHLDDDDPSNPFDRDGLLKDGHSIHVRFRDAVRARGDDDAEYDNACYDSGGHVVGHRPGFVTTADSERIRRDAYEQSKRDMQDAWKAPPHNDVTPSAHDDGVSSHPRQPVSMADAQVIRDTAYLEMCNELTNAWRRT